jgi:hypothetical protein
MGRECSVHGENAYTILVEKPGGKRPRLRCEDTTKTDPRERRWDSVDWSDLGYRLVEDSCEHGN